MVTGIGANYLRGGPTGSHGRPGGRKDGQGWHRCCPGYPRPLAWLCHPDARCPTLHQCQYSAEMKRNVSSVKSSPQHWPSRADCFWRKQHRTTGSAEFLYGRQDLTSPDAYDDNWHCREEPMKTDPEPQLPTVCSRTVWRAGPGRHCQLPQFHTFPTIRDCYPASA